MCASSNPNGSLYDHIDVRGGLAYQKLRTDGAPGVSYRGPFAHLEFEDLLEQDLVREDVALRGRLSLSRLSEDPGVDPGRSERAAWSAGTGAALTLPAPWILMPNVAGIDAEFNQGRGFASQLRPQSLGNLGSVTLSPSLMWWFLPGRKLSLNVHGRYVHTMVSGPGDLGLLEAGVSVLPFWALDVPHVRLHYRYAHELTRGSFREHEVGASTWLQWDFLHLGAEGATRFTRLSSTRTGHSLSGSIRLEVYWDLYL